MLYMEVKLLKKIWENLDDWIACFGIAAIILVTALGVFMRYVLGDPLQWLEEVTIAMYVWCIMMGCASCMKVNGHVSIDIFVLLLPKKAQGYVKLLNHSLSVLVLGSLVVLGYQLAMKAGEKITPFLNIKYTYIDIAVPLGSLWMLAYVIRMIIKDVAEMKADSQSVKRSHDA